MYRVDQTNAITITYLNENYCAQVTKLNIYAIKIIMQNTHLYLFYLTRYSGCGFHSTIPN